MNKYEIKNQGDDQAEITIYGIVTDTEWWEDEVGAKNIIKDIRNIAAKSILVHIYSYGGSVFAGLAIYNALKEHPANITIRVDSIAASIASVIAMAGTVEMPENAFLMIHNPSTSLFGGQAEDFLRAAQFLEDVKDSLITAYHGKSGLENDKISQMMDEETWIMAGEAVELGFADKVIGAAAEPKNLAVLNHFSDFKNVPEQVQVLMNLHNEEPAPDGAKHKPSMKGEIPMEITLAVLEKDAPRLLEQIRAEAMAKGAENERTRIMAVLDQGMPGHEELINTLMFDGETTGPEAAVKVLQAEKQARAKFLQDMDDDAETPAAHVAATDTPPAGDDDGPIEERAKAEWDADKKLRNEFDGDFDAYLAFRENQGNVRDITSNREDK